MKKDILIIVCISLFISLLIGGCVQNAATSEEAETSMTSDSSSDEKSKEAIPHTITVEDLSFCINGISYQLPIKISDLINDGWYLENEADADIILGYKKSKGSVYIYAPDYSERMTINVINFLYDASPLTDCYVNEISIDTPNNQNSFSEISFSSLELNMSNCTPSDIIKALGEPDATVDTLDLYYSYNINHESENNNSYISMHFDDENSTINRLSITNTTAPAGLIQAEVSEEKPSYLSEYVAPTSLGENLLSGNIEISNKVYNIPAPLQEFIEDGWEWDCTENTDIIGAEQTIPVFLTKNGNILFLHVYNPSMKATYIENALVSEISCSVLLPRDDICVQLPQISFPSSKADILKIIEKSETSDYSYDSSYKYYTISCENSTNPDSPLSYINIYFDENNTATKYEIISYSNYSSNNVKSVDSSFFDIEKKADGKYASWQDSFIDYLNNSMECSLESCEYSLIYSDNEATPDMLIETGTKAYGSILLSYKDGNAYIRQVDENYSIKPESYIQIDELLSYITTGKMLSSEHRYELVIEDCTWEEAAQKCLEKGGYLACLTCDEEFEEIDHLIQDSNMNKYCFYIGANRLGDYSWWHWEYENLSNPFCIGLTYEKHWFDNMPSHTAETNDGTKITEKYAEYIYRSADDKFYINDIPNDVIGNYPQYKGKIGYICEYNDTAIN